MEQLRIENFEEYAEPMSEKLTDIENETSRITLEAVERILILWNEQLEVGTIDDSRSFSMLCQCCNIIKLKGLCSAMVHDLRILTNAPR